MQQAAYIAFLKSPFASVITHSSSHYSTVKVLGGPRLMQRNNYYTYTYQNYKSRTVVGIVDLSLMKKVIFACIVCM